MNGYFKFGRKNVWSIGIFNLNLIILEDMPAINFGNFTITFKCKSDDCKSNYSHPSFEQFNGVRPFNCHLLFGGKTQFDIECTSIIYHIINNTFVLYFNSITINDTNR